MRAAAAVAEEVVVVGVYDHTQDRWPRETRPCLPHRLAQYSPQEEMWQREALVAAAVVTAATAMVATWEDEVGAAARVAAVEAGDVDGGCRMRSPRSARRPC